MLPEAILAMMLIYLIGNITMINHRLKIFNHRITAIEKKLRSCGIVVLENEKEK